VLGIIRHLASDEKMVTDTHLNAGCKVYLTGKEEKKGKIRSRKRRLPNKTRLGNRAGGD